MSPVAERPSLEEIDPIQGVVEPCGYHILLRIPPRRETVHKDGKVVMTEETRKLEEFAQLTGLVISLGPLAYNDKKKFGDEPWCRPGDLVMMRAYAGTRFIRRIAETGQEATYALINDDTVLGVIRRAHEEIERVR